MLIVNGDSFCDVNLEAFWEWHRERNADATLLLAHVSDTKRYGRVDVDAQGCVLRFDEKGGNNGPGWINAGVYLLKRQLLETIFLDRDVSLESEMFPSWIGRGLYGYQFTGSFLDIGTPDSYATAEHFFCNRNE